METSITGIQHLVEIPKEVLAMICMNMSAGDIVQLLMTSRILYSYFARDKLLWRHHLSQVRLHHGISLENWRSDETSCDRMRLKACCPEVLIECLRNKSRMINQGHSKGLSFEGKTIAYDLSPTLVPGDRWLVNFTREVSEAGENIFPLRIWDIGAGADGRIAPIATISRGHGTTKYAIQQREAGQGFVIVWTDNASPFVLHEEVCVVEFDTRMKTQLARRTWDIRGQDWWTQKFLIWGKFMVIPHLPDLDISAQFLVIDWTTEKQTAILLPEGKTIKSCKVWHFSSTGVLPYNVSKTNSDEETLEFYAPIGKDGLFSTVGVHPPQETKSVPEWSIPIRRHLAAAGDATPSNSTKPLKCVDYSWSNDTPSKLLVCGSNTCATIQLKNDASFPQVHVFNTGGYNVANVTQLRPVTGREWLLWGTDMPPCVLTMPPFDSDGIQGRVTILDRQPQHPRIKAMVFEWPIAYCTLTGSVVHWAAPRSPVQPAWREVHVWSFEEVFEDVGGSCAV